MLSEDSAEGNLWLVKCWFCDQIATFVSPGDLCDSCWDLWFDNRLTPSQLDSITPEQRKRLKEE